MFYSAVLSLTRHNKLLFSKAADGAKGVPVGSLIAVLAEEGDDISTVDKFVSESASESSEAPKEEKAPEPKVESKSEPTQSKPISDSKTELAIGDRIFASPIAKKIALERGIPLTKLKGTGPSGRIIRDDVEKYKAPVASTSTSATTTSSSSSPAAASPEYTDTPVSNMRRTIGARLTQSKQELPHYYVTVDINMDKVLKLREVFNKTLADKGAKLSVNDFIVKAVALALKDVPEANSAWLGEVIRQ